MSKVTNKNFGVKSFYKSEFFMAVLVAFFSLILMSIITLANPNVFMADDNILQWEPIINKSFDTLFSKGYIPYIDFYQYKMFNTLDAGYYSLNNPFMLASYYLGRFIFGAKLGTISIYIYMMFAMGNVAMYLLLRKLKVSKLNSCLSVFAYSAVSHFILYGFYYFSFNNYFFIPFFLLMIICFNKSKFVYFAVGVSLAFSLLLGQVQYTFYYYIVYGIVMLLISLILNRHYLMIMITNVMSAVILSAPQLLALVLVSGNRSTIIGANEFLSLPISWYGLLALFGMPMYFVQGIHNLIAGGGASRLDLDYYSTLLIYLGSLLPLYVLFIFGYLKKIRNVIYETLNKFSFKFCTKDDIKIRSVFLTTFYFLGICTLAVCLALNYSDDFSVQLTVGLAILFIFVLSFMLFVRRNKVEKWQRLTIWVLMICFPFVTILIGLIYIIHQKISTKTAFPFKDKDNQESENSFIYYLSLSCVAASMFFILLSIGKPGVIGIVLSKIPIIKTFRFLYKCVFIFTPLIVIPASIALNNIKKGRKLVNFLVVFLSIVGISNSLFIVNSGFHTYLNNVRFPYNNDENYVAKISSRIEEIGADKDNYRFLAITEGNEPFAKGNYIESASVDFCDKMTKNMSTMVGVFTLAGYDNTFTKMSYDQSNMILKSIYLNGMYTNAASSYIDFLRISKLKKDDPKVRLYYKQLKENSVKYFLFDKAAEKSLKYFKLLCRKIPEVSIIREVHFINDTVLLEIDGVDSLCKTDKGEMIPMKSDIAELSFNLDNKAPEYVTMSFTYNKNYKAVIEAPDGSKKELEVLSDNSNYTRINTKNIGIGGVTLYYENTLDDLVIVFSIVICILLVCLIAVILFSRNRKSECT